MLNRFDNDTHTAWQTAKYCPTGKGICGIRTQVEGNQGGCEYRVFYIHCSDDTALNNVQFECCDASMYTIVINWIGLFTVEDRQRSNFHAILFCIEVCGHKIWYTTSW